MNDESLNCARRLLESGEYEAAIVLLDTILAAHPTDPDAHNCMALALESIGRWEAARESFDRALAIAPDHANALMSKGGFLTEKLGQWAEAIPLFDAVITIEPAYRLDAHVFRGVALLHLGMTDQAVASFSAAVREPARPGDARSFYHRARALSFLGLKQEALAALRQAFALDRRHCRPEDARADAAFAGLRGEAAFDSLVGVGREAAVDPRDVEDGAMIARIWHGWTTLENAGAYERLLNEEVFPGIAAKGVAGYQGVRLLQRESAAEVEFLTIMWFDTLEAVKQFAGDDYERAYVPPRARALLARFDERSQHYEVRG